MIFYIVATPIGNREDITLRAQRIFREVDFIVAEDTRVSGQLLAAYGIAKPFISFRDAPQAVIDRSYQAIAARLASGEVGAYVTDAGTPGVSDPGWRLVTFLLDQGVTVVPIPGVSAVTALLSVVHVAIDDLRFVGFLPKKKGYQTKLRDCLDYLHHKQSRAFIFFESPYRVHQTLHDIAGLEPGAFVVIGRELTKKFETIYRGPLTESFIQSLPEKGEYIILVTLQAQKS